MSRFHFHLRAGGTIHQDPDGTECADVAAAGVHAAAVATELMRHSDRKTRHWSMIVADERDEPLFELAADAAEHGALSRPRGTVDLSWTQARRSLPTKLTVVWTENGGRPAKRPGRSGAEPSLMEQAVPNATVRREFRADGLVCTMVLPLSDDAERGAAEQG